MKAEVNINQSKQVGNILREINIRESFYSRDFLNVNTDRETKMRMCLFSAAICHQTYTLYHNISDLYGWDFMEFAFVNLVKDRADLLNPFFLSTASLTEIKNHLQVYFSPDKTTENCTLDRLDERCAMLKELGTEIQNYFDGNATKFIDQSEGKLIYKGIGLYESLSKFSSFEDPQRKKITFFIKLAIDSGILEIEDQQNIIPIMDYHMQRVLMRLGCIEILDQKLKQQILHKEIQNSDVEIRQACIDSIKIIAKASGHGILKMNDYFWPLGRSCCNETTLCFDKRCEKHPCSFEQIAELDSHHSCIFENICKGKNDKNYRNLWQPVIETNYY